MSKRATLSDFAATKPGAVPPLAAIIHHGVQGAATLRESLNRKLWVHRLSPAPSDPFGHLNGCRRWG